MPKTCHASDATLDSGSSWLGEYFTQKRSSGGLLLAGLAGCRGCEGACGGMTGPAGRELAATCDTVQLIRPEQANTRKACKIGRQAARTRRPGTGIRFRGSLLDFKLGVHHV